MLVFVNGRFLPEEQAVVSVFDRAFLYGEVEGRGGQARYRLLLLLSDQELKRPAAPAPAP